MPDNQLTGRPYSKEFWTWEEGVLDPAKFKQPLMLDIGAGGYSSDENFTSVDLVTDCDIKAPMWSVPLPNASVAAIFSSNALEHVSKNDIIKTFKEWHRLLVPQGKVQLLVPDLEWAVKFWLDHKNDIGWPLDIIFGHQLHDGEYHKTGFIPDTLVWWLEQSQDDVVQWQVHKVEYMGGEISRELLESKDDADIYKHHVDQRLINLEFSKL